MTRKRKEQRAPNRGNAYDPIKLDRAQNRWRVRHALQPGSSQIARGQDARGQTFTHTRLNRHEILEPRALMDVVSQCEIGIPQPCQRPRHGPRHAGQSPDALEFGKAAGVERRPDRRAKIFGSGWAREAASKARGELRQGHNLHTELRPTCGGDPPHAEGERPLNNDGPTVHHSLCFLRYFPVLLQASSTFFRSVSGVFDPEGNDRRSIGMNFAISNATSSSKT